MSAVAALIEVADPFATGRALNRLLAAGFALEVRESRLLASPFTRLSAPQRAWLKANKADLVAALSTAEWCWLVQYPDGKRCAVFYLPEADWRRVSAEYRGAAVWPVPDNPLAREDLALE